jgi:hypothetical protein
MYAKSSLAIQKILNKTVIILKIKQDPNDGTKK